ncbi:hypothetical protein CN941_02755 [Bacillus cereus]|uniref:hypothetical protein n=1 Tax=Bacillus nitratireducens TaxID=2026193 RepID=UPI0002791E2C|nr:hypothetical protein [Bacillus nitratireducens]EJQ09747.1 hypothetical protein IE3_03323 [Bacillus cereus BAG3X2-1]PEA23126.1 hypothetical protein CON40_01670 [Bacillus cereus]PEV98273.1 hypothetical protein CN428_23965 [Bacillus cereus]PEZ92984.1 hypothetical protein CN374_03290 [Bacillus cereus]PFA31717.1 hypothetical protein CN390_18730 [Bacillus cereus]
MIKQGKYGIYQRKTYCLGKADEEYVNIISRDVTELENGFLPHARDKNFFIKQVKRSDLETAYNVTPFAVYKGIEFVLIGLNEERRTVDIYGIDPKVARELGMSTAGRGEFSKTVPLDDVELIEKIEPIWGFTLDKDN